MVITARPSKNAHGDAAPHETGAVSAMLARQTIEPQRKTAGASLLASSPSFWINNVLTFYLHDGCAKWQF